MKISMRELEEGVFLEDDTITLSARELQNFISKSKVKISKFKKTVENKDLEIKNLQKVNQTLKDELKNTLGDLKSSEKAKKGLICALEILQINSKKKAFSGNYLLQGELDVSV